MSTEPRNGVVCKTIITFMSRATISAAAYTHSLKTMPSAPLDDVHCTTDKDILTGLFIQVPELKRFEVVF